MQVALSQEQIEAFHHDLFVADRVRDFLTLVHVPPGTTVLDVGGGCGHFAQHLGRQAGCQVSVVDSDLASVEICRRSGIPASFGDALDPAVVSDHEVVSFNLILHHLVGANEAATRRLQREAIALWRRPGRRVFVNEYIYESYLGGLSGWLIYQVTKSRVLSALASAVAVVVPSLRANTFGVGVRFRAHAEWEKLFNEAGFVVAARRVGADEPISAARRLLLIKSIRRDSFLLEPKLPFDHGFAS